jgi:hypothetical protein
VTPPDAPGARGAGDRNFYRRPTATYLAHLFKAVFKQHHRSWIDVARRGEARRS